MIQELTPDEFNSSLLPIFERVHDQFIQRKGHRVPGEFNRAHFFEQWQNYMRLGIGRVWKTDGAVLGAVFVKNDFSGDGSAIVSFWDADGRGRGTQELLNECEKAAKENGCTQLFISALNNEQSDKLKRFYRMKGFKESETVFSKIL